MESSFHLQKLTINIFIQLSIAVFTSVSCGSLKIFLEKKFIVLGSFLLTNCPWELTNFEGDYFLEG